MEYRKGDRVRNPKAPEWGVGKVIRDSNDKSVIVFFEGAGERELSLAHVKLQNGGCGSFLGLFMLQFPGSLGTQADSEH